MATKYKVNYELKGDSTVPVTRTECIKHGTSMLNTVLDNKSDASTVSTLTSRVSANETNIATQTSRIDSIAALPSGSTSGDAELIDIRTGADSKTYTSAGAAVRSQISNLNSEISMKSDIQTAVELRNSVSVDFNKLPLYSEKHFITETGALTAANSHNVVKLNVDNIKSFTIESATNFPSNIAICVFYKADNTKISYAMGNNGKSYEISVPDNIGMGGYAAINWLDSGNSRFDYFNSVIAYGASIASAYLDELQLSLKSLPCNDLYGEKTIIDFTKVNTRIGYLGVDNTTGIGNKHKNVIFPSKNVKSVKITGTTSAVPYAYYYNESGVGTAIISGSGGSYEFSESVKGIIGVNYFVGGNYPTTFEVEFFESSSNKEIHYDDCVAKPFSFNGKKAIFFGDSITQGYTSGSSTTTNGFPKLFSDAMGMTFTNKGLGGSCLSYDYNNVLSVPHVMGNTPINDIKTSDFIFIAAGVNDWQTGATASQIKGAVENICQFIGNNSIGGKVIFITPINHGGRTPIVTPVVSLQEVRNIITRVAVTHGHSVVQGDKFPFPTASDDSTYISKMYGDTLHPTELGYTIYARSLRNALC